MTTSALPTRIPGTDPTGENTRVVAFILGIRENASLHPEGSFAIPSAAIFAFSRFEVA